MQLIPKSRGRQPACNDQQLHLLLTLATPDGADVGLTCCRNWFIHPTWMASTGHNYWGMDERGRDECEHSHFSRCRKQLLFMKEDVACGSNREGERTVFLQYMSLVWRLPIGKCWRDTEESYKEPQRSSARELREQKHLEVLVNHSYRGFFEDSPLPTSPSLSSNHQKDLAANFDLISVM